MALHHVATVGLAVLSLISLVLFRAIGPPPATPRALPRLARSSSSQHSHPRLLPPPPPITTPAPFNTNNGSLPKSARCRAPWPTTTLLVGSLWAVKVRHPQWGESPRSYDVSRELLAVTPGTDGLGAFVFGVCLFVGGWLHHVSPLVCVDT